MLRLELCKDENYFKQRLKEEIVKKGIKQKQLAKDLGVCDSTVTYWLNGKRNPSIVQLVNLSNYFNLTIDSLVKKDSK